MLTKSKRFDRMLAKAKEFMPSTYLNRYVAPKFQLMVRAEYAARDELETVIHQGTIQKVRAHTGYCACVTCGKVLWWKADKKSGVEGIDTGHFIAGRRASILLEETNVAPQCVFCNRHNHGMVEAYSRWMLEVRGKAEIDRLRMLNNQVSRKFELEELVTLRIGYMDRIKVAEENIDAG